MLDILVQWFGQNGMALLNVIVIDIVLAGDNAIIVGLAASQVAPELRSRVIMWGIAGAVVLRIIFAGLTSQLLQVVGLTLAGGLLLLWVCWKMYRHIAHHPPAAEPRPLGAAATATAGGVAPARQLGMRAAIWQVIVADVSMSLDNVLAVAGAAKGSPVVLVLGLGIAIVLMAVASHYIASLLVKYPWITWIGLIVILYVAADMIYDGSHEVACKGYETGCEADFLTWARARIFG